MSAENFLREYEHKSFAELAEDLSSAEPPADPTGPPADPIGPPPLSAQDRHAQEELLATAKPKRLPVTPPWPRSGEVARAVPEAPADVPQLEHKANDQSWSSSSWTRPADESWDEPLAAGGSSSSAGPVSSAAELPSQLNEPPQWVQDLRAERAAAEEAGLRWQDRGPPEHQPYWRGQKYREGSDRFANRGGRKKEWWSTYYSEIRKGRSRDQAAEFANLWHGPKA